MELEYMRTISFDTLDTFTPGIVFASARGELPPEAEAAKQQATNAVPIKGYKTCADITMESIFEGLRELKRKDPKEFARWRRIQRAYDEGDINLAVAMEETGYGERKVRAELAAEDYWTDLEERDPAEFAYQSAIRAWKPYLKRRLKEGEISFEVIQASPTPVYTLESVPQSHWPQFQAWVRENVPWKAKGQQTAYERGYCERQRALAMRLFAGFGPERRADHWRSWWHNETPAKQSWWRCRDPKKWTIWRAELQRQIAADNAGCFQ